MEENNREMENLETEVEMDREELFDNIEIDDPLKNENENINEESEHIDVVAMPNIDKAGEIKGRILYNPTPEEEIGDTEQPVTFNMRRPTGTVATPSIDEPGEIKGRIL